MPIDTLRNQMDEITLEMVRLLKKRTDVALEIGRIKKETGMPVTDEAREDALRQKVADLCGEIGLDGSAASRYLNSLLNESVRVQSEGRQTHLTMFHRAKELERQGKNIVHMEVGEPDFEPPAAVSEALASACQKGYTRYGPARGRPELLKMLSEYITKEYHPTDQNKIAVTPGARFAVYAAITSILKPGDEAVIIEPAWPAYRDCVMHAGAKPRTIPTKMEDKWVPDMSQIEQAITPNTRMIILNYPNNPTGRILPDKTINDIMQIARTNGLYVLSDEIYSQYSKNKPSIMPHEYEKSITTQSFSKSHAMTGMRIGYAIADPGIIEKITSLSSLCLTSVSEPVQLAAMAALKSDVSGFADIMRRRLDALGRAAKEAGFEFVPPDGGMYLFCRADMDGSELCERALDAGVAAAPGGGFGAYPDHIRVSACQDEKILIDGMGTLGKVSG